MGSFFFKNIVFTWKRLLSLIWLFSMALPCFSDSIAEFYIRNLEGQAVNLNQHWKFHPGDDPSWADPAYNDRHWALMDPSTDIHYLTELRESGIGWFRLHLGVNEALWNIPLAMLIYQRGASEIYLNGKLVHKLGVVSKNPAEERTFNPNLTPYSFQFEKLPNQVLAVRFSFTDRNPYIHFHGGNPTLVILLDEMDHAIQAMLHTKAEVSSRLVGKAAILLFLALLHLSFYVTYPANKTNLYYSFFTISLAFIFFLEHILHWMPREGDTYFIAGLISSLFFSTFIIWGLLAVYSFAREKLDSLFWFATVSALLIIPTWKWPYEAASYYWSYYLTMGPLIAVLISWRAVRKNIKGAWLIFFGWMGNLIFWGMFCLFHSNTLTRIPHDMAITLDLAIFCTAISFSVLLAIEYTQMNRSLQSSLLDMKMKHLEGEKMQELDKIKPDLFANNYHEFRTPAFLISSSDEKLDTLYKHQQYQKPEDEKFMIKALAILEEHIMDTDFDVSIFSREIGMSRTNLHRKLKALTNFSATEFIRVFRLNRAKYLLEHKAGNINEVAYAVGFNSISYFTKCFKKQYGMTPSDFLHSFV